MNDSWSLSHVWNKSLDTDRQRELKQRDYVWASELGGSYYDRYWKMKGRQLTTPPNFRAQRKFEAGNLAEWMVLQVLKRAGILQETQTTVEFTEGPIKVRGRCDFIAGGEIQDVDLSDLPESLADMSAATLQNLKELFPTGLATQGLELKSCSAQIFNKYERAPSMQHGLQAFHYAHTLDLPFHLVYLCRDDLRMVEYVILPDSEKWMELYMNDLDYIANMISAVDTGSAEAGDYAEPLIAWNEEDKKFEKNWKVEYSGYLTDYGFERPDEYADKAKMATRLNNVVKSVNAGTKLRKANLEAIELVKGFYQPAYLKLIDMMEAKGYATQLAEAVS